MTTSPTWSPDPIVSWRALEIRQWHDRVWFVSQSGRGQHWPHFRRQESFCSFRQNHDPTVPELSCSCGFYSFKTFPLLVESHYVVSGQTVIARLYNWGRVIECTNGYRSQFVYPKDCIAVSSELARNIERCYGIPCVVANPKQMWEKAKREAMEKARKIAMEKFNTFNPWGIEDRKDDDDIPF